MHQPIDGSLSLRLTFSLLSIFPLRLTTSKYFPIQSFTWGISKNVVADMHPLVWSFESNAKRDTLFEVFGYCNVYCTPSFFLFLVKLWMISGFQGLSTRLAFGRWRKSISSTTTTEAIGLWPQLVPSNCIVLSLPVGDRARIFAGSLSLWKKELASDEYKARISISD